MEQKRIGNFLAKMLLFTSPFWALIIVYLVVDPFKVIWKYDSYYPARGISVVVLNDDYTGTQNFLNKYKGQNYNAYILGNSRAFVYRVADLEKHINRQKFLHLNSSNESIFGIERKLNLIDKLGCKIDYVLLVIDGDVLSSTVNAAEYQFEKHPILSGKNNILFQMDFAETFFDVHYFPAFMQYLIFGQQKSYITHVLQNLPIEYSATENELRFYYYDSLLHNNPDAYYGPKRHIFYERPEKERVADPIISEQQRALLANIKSVFAGHATKYKIVINPLYNQVKFNGNDKAQLDSIFGAENVFDFSGINSITEDYRNYYETSHYRPTVAARIMDSIYADKAIN